jgi:hypothetical protein
MKCLGFSRDAYPNTPGTQAEIVLGQVFRVTLETLVLIPEDQKFEKPCSKIDGPSSCHRTLVDGGGHESAKSSLDAGVFGEMSD